MSRISEQGWISAAMHDPSERRGIWYRSNDGYVGNLERLEICGGREGEDAYVSLSCQELTQQKLVELESILGISHWVLNDYELPIVRRRANLRGMSNDNAADVDDQQPIAYGCVDCRMSNDGFHRDDCHTAQRPMAALRIRRPR